MKLYCRQDEEWTPRNWGLSDWLSIIAIVISLAATAVSWIAINRVTP